MTINTLNPFTLRVRIDQFFKEKGRIPSEEEIKEMDAKITAERIASNAVYGTINPVAYTSVEDHEHEDDDRVYQQSFKAQMELLKEVLSNSIQKDQKVESKYPKIVVCDLLDHIDGNPPVKNLPNDKIMEPYREFSKELEENFDYDECTCGLKRKEKPNDNKGNQNRKSG